MGFVFEEVPDRAPDVFLRAEVAHAARGAARLQLPEKLGELGVARPERGDAAGFDVAGVIHRARELSERASRLVAILGGVLAVGGVEEVDVVAARVVARLRELERESRHAGGDGAAARGRLEELALVEFPGLRGVREEHRLDLGVPAPDPLQREEEELLREAPLRLVHAARDVEREDHRGARRRRRALVQLAEAQVLVDDGDGAFVEGFPLDRFLQCAPSVEAGAGAALVPALAHVVGLVQRRGAPGLELRELELLPEPVDDLIDLELDDELDFAVARAAGPAFGIALFARRLQHVAGRALALAGAGPGLRIEQAKARVLEELDGHDDRAVFRPADEVRSREELGQALLDRRAHLLVVPQPVAGASGKEVVPGGFGGDADRHGFGPLTRGPWLFLRQQRRYVVERFTGAVG